MEEIESLPQDEEIVRTQAVEELSKIRELKDLAGKVLDAQLGSQVNSLLTAYAVTGKRRLIRTAEKIIALHTPKILNAKNPVHEVPSEPDMDGRFELGVIMSGDAVAGRFRLRDSDCVRHIAIYGQSGHGKSTLLNWFRHRFIQQKISFVEFDVKGDGKKILRKHKDLVIIPISILPVNLLIPPKGMDVIDWFAQWSRTSTQIWGLWHGAANFLFEALVELYNELKSKGRFVTILDLRNHIASKEMTHRRLQEYQDAVLNRLTPTVQILRNAASCETGIEFENLLSRSCIIDMSQLRIDEQIWFITIALTHLYYSHLVQNLRGEKLRAAIFIDEAHAIFDRNQEISETAKEMGIPTTSLFHQRFRDFGLSLIVTSQQPEQMMHSVHANTLVKFIGNLSSGSDINSIADTIGLNEDDRHQIGKLRRGIWIVKMSDRHTKPFVLQTPDYPTDDDVSDEEILQRLKEKIPEIFEYQVHDESLLPQLSKEAGALITDVCSHPFRGISKRFKILGFSGSRGEAAKSELIRHNLLREQPVKLGKFKPVTFLIPTESGLKHLKSIGQDVKNWDFVGYNISFEHRLWQWLIYAAYKDQEYETLFEHKIERYRVDVFATKGEERIAVEVALTAGIDLKKIFTLLRNASKLLILCKDERVKQEVEKVIDKNAYERVRPRITVTIANQFLDELRRTTTTTQTTPTNVDGVGKEIGGKRF